MAGSAPADILNRRSTGFKALKVDVADDQHALQIMLNDPKTMIRPALVVDGKATFGFAEDEFQKLLG